MKLSVLGSTGSIGTQTLDVARKQGYEIKTLVANRNVKKIEEQIREFRPEIAVMNDMQAAKDLKIKISDTDTKVLCGDDGIEAAATLKDADTVLNSFVGMAGLVPTVAAINAGKTIALANKETLVAGGDYVMNLAKKIGVDILPVDSEHSAIFQCLQGAPSDRALKKIILTASGGPFFNKTIEDLKNVSLKEALNHPNWSMGAKITIDSATMMNKGLEIIEAYWLFSVPVENIDVVVHRESIIHSLVMYDDNSVIAQLGVPDMRIPIQYAITYPNRFESPVKELDLAEVATMTFAKPDEETFKCMACCKKALKIGKTAPAIVNGANEAANQLFRDNKISFLEIGDLVEKSLENVPIVEPKTLEDVLNADKLAREFVINSVNCK